MTRPRVLLFTALTGSGWGGSENYWFDALRSPLVTEGVEIHVLMERNPETERRALELATRDIAVSWYAPPGRQVGHRLWRAASRRPDAPGHDPLSRKWRRLITGLRPDLVWINLPGISAFPIVVSATTVLRDHHVPYWVVVQHCEENCFADSDAAASRLRAVMVGAQRTVFVAKRNRRSVERAIASKLANACMSANTVPDSFWAEIARRTAHGRPRESGGVEPCLLNLARLDPCFKGQHILLEILSDPRWRDREWRLCLCGGGPSEDTVRRLVRYYGFDQRRVELVGYSGAVLDVIMEADLMVMPSLSEGTPFALLEGMAAGRPAVASPVGGIPELVLEARTGWLATAPDVPNFGQALERAWRSRASWAEVGRNAAAHIRQNYSAQPWMRMLGELLRSDAVPRT